MLKNDSNLGARELYNRVVGQERQASQPLPEHLAERLRAIPRLEALAGQPDAELSCHDLERHLAESEDGFASEALERHLQSCRACRRLYGPARDLAAGPAQELPSDLRQSLLAIPSQQATSSGAADSEPTRRVSDVRPRRRRAEPRRRVSAWIHDARYAAMACYLLTAGVMWAAGDLPAHFQSARKAAGEQATAWVESGRTGGGELTDAVANELTQRVGQGREWLLQGGAAWTRFVERTEDRLRTFPPDFRDGAESLASQESPVPSESPEPSETEPPESDDSETDNEPSSALDPSDQGERDGTAR